jgi:hypothetical protein
MAIAISFTQNSTPDLLAVALANIPETPVGSAVRPVGGQNLHRRIRMGSPFGSPVSGTLKAPPQSSAEQNTAVGSGSRPGTTKFRIESSAPMNPRMLDRDPPMGWLGSGKTRQQGE